MSKAKFDAKRRVTASNLRRLADVLLKRGICTDLSALFSAASQCVSEKPKGISSWGYDISNLIFRFQTPKGTIPKEAKNFRIEFSMRVRGDFGNNESDQFEELAIDLEKYVELDNSPDLKSAWHFDKHVGDKGQITREVHPLYHLQFGGNKLNECHDNLGAMFLSEPPRLMYPPMDGILAIDFVLSNYAGSVWNDLRVDGEYMNLVKPAYDGLWKPYFEAIVSSWSNPPLANNQLLCPHIC